MSRSLRFDFYIILGIIFLSVPIILYLEVRPLTSALFFFIIPTAYLFLRKGKPIKEVLIGSALIGSGLGLIFNIIISANGGWDEAASQLVFNYRIFGFLPADEPIWFFFWALFIIVFYEHFYEKHRADKLSRRFRYIAIPTLLAVILVVTVAIIDKDKLLFSNAYFFSATPSIIPVLYVIKRRPNMVLKFVKTGAFFFMLFLVYELTAIKLGQWHFPGQYIGQVELLGLKFPLEELLFWMGISSFVVLSVYEGFVDNDK